MYHFSRYWGSWSRVLCEATAELPYVEVNLTPIPASYSCTWENHVAPIRLRRHLTPRDPEDIETDELPSDVLALMTTNLGVDLVGRLLSEDFLSQVDWDKYNQVCNGGANLDQIRKEQ